MLYYIFYNIYHLIYNIIYFNKMNLVRLVIVHFVMWHILYVAFFNNQINNN